LIVSDKTSLPLADERKKLSYVAIKERLNGDNKSLETVHLKGKYAFGLAKI